MKCVTRLYLNVYDIQCSHGDNIKMIIMKDLKEVLYMYGSSRMKSSTTKYSGLVQSYEMYPV